MAKNIFDIAKAVSFELQFGQQFEKTISGFFRCTCGKLHMYSWMNQNCPNCGRRLHH